MQRLLALCGLRWELQLVTGGATAAERRSRSALVQQRARRRGDASVFRRMAENAAARDTAASLESAPVSGREVRRRCRAARLDERAFQAANFAALVTSDDEEARDWLVRDESASIELSMSALQWWAPPMTERLPQAMRGPAEGGLRGLLAAMSHEWPWPSLALTGWLARAVWSPPPPMARPKEVQLACLRGDGPAEAFMASIGASPAGPRRFELGALRIRLLPGAPQATSLVQSRPGLPVRGVATARPESRPGAECDRHAVRAALAGASRDRRGRRRPPYHETWDGAVKPWWVKPAASDNVSALSAVRT
ncbi:MAG: hypothetical protein WCB04_04755, partial [Mycobacteriales bacterium]